MLTCVRAEDADQLLESARGLLAKDGPSFLLIKIEPDREERKIGRITHRASAHCQSLYASH